MKRVAIFEKSLYYVAQLHYRLEKTPRQAYVKYVSEWHPLPSRTRPGQTSWKHLCGTTVQDMEIICSDTILMQILVKAWTQQQQQQTDERGSFGSRSAEQQ